MSTFTGTLAGSSGISIVTLALTGATVLSLGGTLTYTGTFTLSGLATNGVVLANGKTHLGGITINASNRSFVFNDFFTCNGIFTLTTGTASGVNISVGTMSLSNSNVRTFSFTNLYLTGSGTLLNIATQTNLTWSVSDIYLTNTTASSKTMSISNLVVCDNIYLQGSGASATTITCAVSAVIYPNVIISKTGGTLVFGTSYFTSITYIEGSTISWAGSSTVTVYGDVTLCNSMSITTSNALTFAENTTQTLTTFNKTFTGTLTVDDGGTGAGILIVNGNYTSTSTSTNAIAIRACGLVIFNNPVLLTSGGISINGSGVTATVDFNDSVTATAVTIAEGDVILGNTTLTGALTLNSGNLSLYANSIVNINNFVSSSTTNFRDIYLGSNTIINLTSTTNGSVWNTANGITQGVLTFNAGTSTINIIGQSNSDLTFSGGGITLWDLNINRGNGGSYNPSTSFFNNITFRNFKDLTRLASGFQHTISFSVGFTIIIQDTFQVGNTNNLTLIYPSVISGSSFTLVKQNPGLVICPNVRILYSTASPANTWYAISGSINDGDTTGWIFNDIPRRLGSLGAG
jgi:hypothetical protein